MKKIYIFTVGLFAVLSLVTACDNGNTKAVPPTEGTLAKVQREGVLRIGYIPYPPIVSKDPVSGKRTGTSVEAIEYIASIMEVKLEYHEVTWTTFAGGLQTGQFDLCIAPTFATIPRAMNVAFTRPILYVGNGAIVRKNEERFKTINDLDRKGLTIAVTQGEAGHEYAKENFENAKLTVIDSPDLNLAFTEVAIGRADAALGDSWATTHYVAEHPEVKDLFAENPYNVTPVCWSVRYGDADWLNYINTCIEFLDSSGEFEEWDIKYNAHFLRRAYIWEKY